MAKLSQKFYMQPTLKIAKQLLGKLLIHKVEKIKYIGRIIETEAYCGFNDLASHASHGRTKRTEIMFGSGGFAYVYMIYGMYYCFNVVTEEKNFPAAVLIRALEPITPTVDEYNKTSCKYDSQPASGPGKLCRYMKIDKSLNKIDLTKDKIWIENDDIKISDKDIINSKRIGINYAKNSAELKWRFFINKNKYVS